MLWHGRRGALAVVGIAGSILLMRSLGLLQLAELAALDWMFRLRPLEAVDERVVIVSIDDSDIDQLQAWPISDQVMADLLETLNSYQPRVVGLDIYRDIPVGEGNNQLQQIFQSTPNLIGIEKLPDTVGKGVSPPDTLDQQDQIGFNNVVVDPDGNVRRMLAFWTIGERNHRSFALQLALAYLEPEGFQLKPSDQNPAYFALGGHTFAQIVAHYGGYANIDAGGYQLLANLRGPAGRFIRVSMSDVLARRVSPELFRDRIVLIGSVAPSLRDFFYTSYSDAAGANAKPMAGVELHANFVSQIINTALNDRPLLKALPRPIELIWIVSWSVVGIVTCWRLRSPQWAIPGIGVVVLALSGLCFLAFLSGWWVPLVPSALALTGSAIAMISHMAHLQVELRKSKEFLQSVINTIPDPIFVKDRTHRWIVLNQAYCRFIGYPLEKLIEKSEYDFLPAEQAAHCWQQDSLTFATGLESESEEVFTDINGLKHLISTKRTLHRDAAGNIFLVGSIRDITQFKLKEEELRRTAEELVRSNAALKEAEGRLRHMAYYDDLTGLPNRTLLEDRLTQAIELAHTQGLVIAALFLDLDGFKQINDTHGHLIGDLLLKIVAQRLSRCLRGSDIVARLGGDEFVVVLQSIADQDDIAKVAEKILTTLSQSFVLEGITIQISTSIGISLFPSDGDNVEQLLKLADQAMYRAKQQGKNTYQRYGAGFGC